ncbi:MAG: MEDS domain-containing protein [Candidatus Bathyarchaeia archaeon]
MEKEEILGFVRNMKAKDHVILFHSKPEDKRLVLFTYLKAGLDNREAAAYVAGEEPVEEVRRAMKDFGLKVEELEETGALRIIDYREWYIIEGKFDASKTIGLWKKLYDEALAYGFKGLRVTGEMACFFRHGMVKELIEYEKSLHRVLELPIAAICTYNTDLVAKEGRGELFLDLIKMHSTVIILGQELGLVKSH